MRAAVGSAESLVLLKVSRALSIVDHNWEVVGPNCDEVLGGSTL